MTFRARPTSKSSHTWDQRSRRSMLLNVGFGITVIVALLLLATAWGVSWYGDHLAAAASVNGQTISKDTYQKQLAIDAFRLDYQASRVRTLLTAGHIRTSDAQARLSLIDQRKQQASTIALEQLIDGSVMAQLAPAQGVTVTDTDVDARFAEEATTPELRHVWVIEIAPTLATGESVATDAEKAAAKSKADQVLQQLKGGGDWETIAKAQSTDASKSKGGDLGYIDKDATLDADFVTALMAAPKDTPTAVIEGADGSYRIGRVTEIVAPVTDATLASRLGDAGISMDDFRAALRRDVVRQRLSDAVLATYLAPGPQREVSEIYMQFGQSESGPNAIKVRHILYSPNHDPANASKVPEGDKAWADAQALAQATYDKLKADPSQFDAIARTDSDESAARTSGGKLPYFSTNDAIDPAFAAAIFAPGLQPGQLLPPVKSAFGWHVIQVMHGPTDAQWATKLRDDIIAGRLKFADAARDNSDNAEAAKGGDIGWVGKGQLSSAQLEQAIFAAPVGKVSDPVTIAGDGTYLFFVSQEKTAAPNAEQKASLEGTAFPTWYTAQKATFTITRDPSISSTATS